VIVEYDLNNGYEEQNDRRNDANMNFEKSVDSIELMGNDNEDSLLLSWIQQIQLLEIQLRTKTYQMKQDSES